MTPAVTLEDGTDYVPTAPVYLMPQHFSAIAAAGPIVGPIVACEQFGRYIIQELFDWRTRTGAVVGTLATVAVPLLFIATADAEAPGRPPTYMAFWTLFGTSNQLLAALTLLGITVWRKRLGKSVWFTYLPMLFVLGITVWALSLQASAGFAAFHGPGGTYAPTELANGLVATTLLILAGLVVVEALRALRPTAN